MTLREIREQRGLSQKQLAMLVGVHWRTIQDWEKGVVPRPIYLRELAKTLHIPADDLANIA